MKRLSLQWRITLLTALLIACACVCFPLLYTSSCSILAFLKLKSEYDI